MKEINNAKDKCAKYDSIIMIILLNWATIPQGRCDLHGNELLSNNRTRLFDRLQK